MALMRAAVFDAYGPPDVLRIDNHTPVPEPSAGELLIRVVAAGVNPYDAKLRRGIFQEANPLDLPHRIGNEYSGVVVGGRGEFPVGTAVLGSATWQSNAEFVVVPSSDAVRRPDDLDFVTAGGLPAVVQTAWTALEAIGVNAGDTVLVHAAAGGVGSAAVQIARLWGAKVIGTASPANHAYLAQLGATPVTYGDDLVALVRATLGGCTIDAALDLVGGESIDQSLELGIDPQRIGTTVNSDAPARLGIQRVGGRSTEGLAKCVELFARGELVMPVTRTYPLARIAEAHQEIESGHVRGKIVLTL